MTGDDKGNFDTDFTDSFETGEEYDDAARMLWTAGIEGSPELIAKIFEEFIRPLVARPNGAELLAHALLKIISFLSSMVGDHLEVEADFIVQEIALIEYQKRLT